MKRLGECLKRWRLFEGVGLRELSKELKMSPATLSRMENGKECESRHLAAVFRWMTERPTSIGPKKGKK